MAVMAAIAVGTAVVGAASAIRGGRQAKSAASKQASLFMEQSRESIRRAEQQHDYSMGQGETAVYASGIQMGGSAEQLLQDRDRMFKDEVAWMERAAHSQASAIKAGGSAAQSQAWFDAAGTLGQGAASGYSYWKGA